MGIENYYFHYIRKYNKFFPYFEFLHENNFKKIVKTQKKNLIKIEENIDVDYKKKKYIFSFDDGLKDHLFASKILRKNSVLGLFFINTLPLMEKKILNVHKIHLLFGRYDIMEIIKKMNTYENFKLEKMKITNAKKYQLKSLLHRKNLNRIKLKIFLNKNKNTLLVNKLFDYFFSKFLQKKMVSELYLNKDDILKIDKREMIIGGHSHAHQSLSSLSFKKQNIAIKKNLYCLSKILNKKIDYFASPWGNQKSFNSNTIKILKKNVKFHFTTLRNKFPKDNYNIPRINCNKLKGGKIFDYRKNNVE